MVNVNCSPATDRNQRAGTGSFEGISAELEAGNTLFLLIRLIVIAKFKTIPGQCGLLRDEKEGSWPGIVRRKRCPYWY